MTSNTPAEWSPNDWPESVAELRTIDNLLRCSICFEYFNIAVTIPECSHNYCSLCIRQSLNYEAQCPTCSVKATEKDLKNNRVLDHLVKSFTKIRGKLLEVVKSDCNNTSIVNNHALKTLHSEKRERKREKTSPEGAALTKKRKRLKLENEELASLEAPAVSAVKSHDIETASNASSSDSDLILVSVRTPCAKKETAAHNKPHSRQSQTKTDLQDMAACPVCGDMVVERTINSHLDACLLRSEKKEALRKNRCSASQKTEAQVSSTTTQCIEQREQPSPEIQDKTDETSNSSSLSASNSFINPVKKRKTLPKLVYTLLNDKQLRQRLKEFHLSTQGTRETLIKRHQEFVILYNSQCDSTNPKSVAEIARQVEKQEKTRLKLTFTGSAVGAAGKNQGDEEKEKARVQCLKENDEHFQQLINDIRKRDRGKKIRAKRKKLDTVIDEEMDKQNVSEPESTDGPCSFASDRSTLDNSQKPQSNNGSSDVPNQDEENSHTGSTSHGDQVLDDTPVKPFSVVPEAPSSSNLESLGDDDSDSNCTPSLGLDIEQESDEDDVEKHEDDSCSLLSNQSSSDVPGVIPESPVIGCSKARPEETYSNTDENIDQEQLITDNEEYPKRSKRKLKLKSNQK